MKVWAMVLFVAMATAIPVSVQHTSRGVELTVDHADAYTYRRARVTYRRAYRRGYRRAYYGAAYSAGYYGYGYGYRYPYYGYRRYW